LDYDLVKQNEIGIIMHIWQRLARTGKSKNFFGRVYSRVLKNSMLKNNRQIKALMVSLIIEWE
jgi:hypothetical protein